MFERFRIGSYLHGWVRHVRAEGIILDTSVARFFCEHLEFAVDFMKRQRRSPDQVGQLHIIHFVNSLHEVGALEVLRREQPGLFGSLKAVYDASYLAIFLRADRYQDAILAHRAEVSDWMAAH